MFPNHQIHNLDANGRAALANCRAVLGKFNAIPDAS